MFELNSSVNNYNIVRELRAHFNWRQKKLSH